MSISLLKQIFRSVDEILNLRQQPFNENPLHPHERQPSFNSIPRPNLISENSANKTEQSKPSLSFDFLPSVNFDDFHASLTGDSLIDAFPAPGGDKDHFKTITKGSTTTLSRPALVGPSRTIDMSEVHSRQPPLIVNGASPQHQDSVSQTAAQIAANRESHSSGYTPTAATRARRKTYFPPTTGNTNGVRAPRKSVGPGILTANLDGQAAQRLTIDPDVKEGRRSESNDTSSNRRPNVVEDARRQKAKSFHSPRRGADQPATPSESLSDFDFFSSSASKSPGRSTGGRMTTPSSMKRLSIMPNSAHATGLAARTISPTDARRLKRMSMIPSVPPVPYTPPTPQADHIPSPALPQNPSPSLIPRKSVTPSSSRTTPDPNRKSYSSGLSASSNTSFGSFPLINGLNRVSQSFVTSRLPTLKMRGDNVVLSDEEVVPPVPAIPKAYESPKGEFDQPFFSNRKPSFGFDGSSLASMSSHGGAQGDLNLQKIDPELAARKPSTDIERMTDRKPNSGAGAGINRRTLQPLRLPPLNLLPLSTPTTTKIAALGNSFNSSSTGTVTPPPKIGVEPVPSTPMTASKVHMPKNFGAEETRPVATQVRSNSSYHAVRPEPIPYRAPSSTSTQTTTPVERYATPASRAAMSPFVSSSLPKSSGEFGPLRREISNPVNAMPEIKSDIRQSRLTGPRLQKPRKVSKDDASSLDTASSVDNSNQPLGNSIRRRLSLSRKRSGSKAQTADERDVEVPSNPPKYTDMPPPKLPASATWSGPLLPSPSPTRKPNHSRTSRNVSNSGTVVPNDRSRSQTWDASDTSSKASGQENKQDKTATPSEQNRTVRSLLEGTSNKNGLSLKDFQEAKRLDVSMDRDDLSAEEEMKKLASKRKDTENAAKVLDALQRRATPKERLDPNLALQRDREKYRRHLNTFEVGEVVDYKDVYFSGNDNIAKHIGDLTNEAGNYGYDDERGDYNIVNGDHLAYRYEVVDLLGKGSFGQVVRCIDHKHGALVAVKIIRNKKRFHQQALVEVDILKKLREWVQSDTPLSSC